MSGYDYSQEVANELLESQDKELDQLRAELAAHKADNAMLREALRNTTKALEYRWEHIANRASPVWETEIDKAHTEAIEALSRTPADSYQILVELREELEAEKRINAEQHQQHTDYLLTVEPMLREKDAELVKLREELEFQRIGHNRAQERLLEQGAEFAEQLTAAQAEIEKLREENNHQSTTLAMQEVAISKLREQLTAAQARIAELEKGNQNDNEN